MALCLHTRVCIAGSCPFVTAARRAHRQPLLPRAPAPALPAPPSAPPPNLPPPLSLQLDLTLRPHLPLLKALYSRYRIKPSGGGLRARVLKVDGWQQLMADAHLVDAAFTLSDATLAFLWSRMFVADEVKDYAKWVLLLVAPCLSF